jgi:hypothetical protein
LANQLFTWSDATAAGVVYKGGGPPAGGAMITSADMNTYIQNDGSYPWGYASNQCMTFGDFTTHKVLYTAHSTTITSTSAAVYDYSHLVGGTMEHAANAPGLITTYSTGSAISPSSSYPISISLSITGLPYQALTSDGSTYAHAQIDASLVNPAGTVVQNYFATSGTTLTGTYTAGGAAGVWKWNIYVTYDFPDGTSTLGTAHNIGWSGSYVYYA